MALVYACYRAGASPAGSFPFLIPCQTPPFFTGGLVLNSGYEKDPRRVPVGLGVCYACLCRLTSSPPPPSSPSPRSRIEMFPVQLDRGSVLAGHRIGLSSSRNQVSWVTGQVSGSRISLDAVTLGTIAAPRIVLHSGHEEVSSRGAHADGFRCPGICVALAPSFVPKAESSAGCSSAESSSKESHATQAPRRA